MINETVAGDSKSSSKFTDSARIFQENRPAVLHKTLIDGSDEIVSTEHWTEFPSFCEG